MLGGPHVGFTSAGGAASTSTWGKALTAHFHGAGSPNGVVTPTHIGDLYVDDTGGHLWQAKGTLVTTWVEVGAPPPAVLIKTWYAEFFGHTTLTTTPPITGFTPTKGSVLFAGQFHVPYTGTRTEPFSQSGVSLYGTCVAGGYPYYGSAWAANAPATVKATLVVMNATCTEFMQVSTPAQSILATGHFPMTTLTFSHGTDLVHTQRKTTTWAVKSTAGGLYAVYVILGINKMTS
jgi:hypothetical protein